MYRYQKTMMKENYENLSVSGLSEKERWTDKEEDDKKKNKMKKWH